MPARLRHRVPHAAGHDPAHRRLQARPHAGRRPPHRPGPHRGDRRRPEGIRLLLADSTNADEHGHAPLRDDRSARCSTTCSTSTRAGASSPPASPATSTACSRSPTPPSPSTAVIATSGMSMKKNVRLAREMGLLTHPRRRLVDIEDIDDLDPAKVCVISTGSQGEPMSALALMAASENRWLKLGADDIVILSSHPIPGNEANVTKVIDGLRPPRRRGRALRHRRRARHRPRQAGGAQDAPLDRPPRVVHPGARRVPPPGRPRQARRRPWACRPDHMLVCEDGDQLLLDRRGPRRDRPGAGRLPLRRRHRRRRRPRRAARPPGAGRGGRRGRRGRRRRRQRAIITGPEVITRGWVYAPEAEDLLDECGDRGAPTR